MAKTIEDKNQRVLWRILKEEDFNYFLIEIVMKLIVSHKNSTSVEMALSKDNCFNKKSITSLVYH